MLANKLRTLKRSFDDEGLSGPLSKIAIHFLIQNRVSPTLKQFLGAKLHLKIYMWIMLGYWPNIEDPKTFNEKIAHRKLYSNNKLYSMVEDKYRVREYVSERVDRQILPELYHVTEDPKTIPFEELPEEYVIKPNHMAGAIEFIEGSPENENRLQKRAQTWLDTTHNVMKEESWYWDITPRILVEEYLKEKDGAVPSDLKFFVFHGQVEYIQVDSDRFGDHKRRFYDREWNSYEFKRGYPLAPKTSEPPQLETMINIAENLGKDFDFIRVDLYEIGGEEVVFGEMTVGPASGVGEFDPKKHDYEFGSLW